MQGSNWREERDNRSLLYSGRVLNPDHWITVVADSDYAARYDGQVALLTAANLLGRMSPSIAFHLPSVSIVNPLPNAGRELSQSLAQMLYAQDPYGNFEFRKPRDNDYIIVLGKKGAKEVVHGSGWNVFCGNSPSPIEEDSSINPIGPALAVVLAVSQAFRLNLSKPQTRFRLNALTWKSSLTDLRVAPLSSTPRVFGDIWTVGTGSVGTAILYFLSLATKQFSGVLFDHDIVKTQNLDRSPIFTYKNLNQNKATATQEFLSQLGIRMETETVSLDESEIWSNRPTGTPDILVASANERNVRSVIENNFPPIQIYGTTGQSWQASVIRHIPFRDPCSLCLFPEIGFKPTECATTTIETHQEQSVQVDSALPFLSFAAGIMAAAEILKLLLPEYPLNTNRVFLYTYTTPQTRSVPLNAREHCRCSDRSSNVHHQMIENTRFAKLSAI